ncbi:hypothetical protein [Reichenbachiella ulvae]|uniref:Secreted protein n=1 Tax=Reichenbachiella ulvae TaxID=2980104 RepID=A0ABT3CU48_9BACT|nr:hypothetical protein [Reichenbachiella ulvae]MCV9387079.1 hypothetical protein [Reichenbachiella ulvae]
MKFIKALFVAFSLLTLVSACSQEEDIIAPQIDIEEAEYSAGDRDQGKTPPELGE